VALNISEGSALLGLVVLMVIFTVLAPGEFASVENLRNVLTYASILLILAVGTTFVVIAGGFDLSIGSVLVFSQVISAKVMVEVGGSGWLTIVVGAVSALAAGAAWGLLNGYAIAYLRLNPFVVTLATLGMALGCAQIISGGVDIAEVPPLLVDTIGNGRLAGIPAITLIALAICLLGGLALALTRWGTYVYALGSSEEAARRAGINVPRRRLAIYVLMGGLAGLAGELALAQFGSTTIGGHQIENLAAITAVVLGGTSLWGGVGTVFGTVIGVCIPAILANGLVILGVQAYWQAVAVGAVLLVAIYVDQVRRQRAY
jgi:ribose transport system permease protein